MNIDRQFDIQASAFSANSGANRGGSHPIDTMWRANLAAACFAQCSDG